MHPKMRRLRRETAAWLAVLVFAAVLFAERIVGL